MSNRELLSEIRGWRSRGELGARASELARALATIADSHLRERAGYALRDVPCEAFGGAAVPVRLGIVSNFTPGGLEHLLRARLISEGIYPELYVAGFGEHVSQLLDPQSELYQRSTEVALCLLDEQVVLGRVEGGPWRLGAVERALEESAALLGRLVASFLASGAGTLVLNTPHLSQASLASVLDHPGKARLAAMWRRFQAQVLALTEQSARVVVLDTDVLMQAPGAGPCDPRLAFQASMSMSEGLLDAIAAELVKVVRAVLGKNKKGLMLDLDNTLWGGILGDSGPTGIDLGDSARGKAHKALQKVALGLKEQGVLLAINSKNERKDVLEVLQVHPDLVLRESDFVAIEANWEPKHINARRLAQKLNLGADAFVFMDDSAYERHLVAETIPGLVAPELPDDAAYYPAILLAGGWFDVLSLTAEDRERTALYKSELLRDELKSDLASFEAYVQALGVEVDLVVPDRFRLARFAQLGQRTNQFNLTGRRYQVGELEGMLASRRHLVLGVEGRDRFGAYGLVGGVVIEQTGERHEQWWIRNFLLSCRVFSRGIEGAVLCHLLRAARAAGAAAVHGEFVPSRKNGRFESFYPSHGFVALEAQAGARLYRHDLSTIDDPAPWLVVRQLEETAT